MMGEVGFFTEKVRAFRAANDSDDLDNAVDGGPLIRFYEEGGRIKMLLEIGEDTSGKSIERSWSLIKEWRRRLLSFQGRHLVGDDSGFYEELSMKWGSPDTQWTYQQVADWVNQRLAAHLQEHAACVEEFNRVKHTFKTDWDRVVWETEHNRLILARFHADDLLRLCRPSLSMEERSDWLMPAVERINTGEPPFPPNTEPVTADDIRHRIRQWRKKRDSEGW